MAVAARHVFAAGVALLGVGAFAFTPVALPLQALTLRTVAVPAGDLAQLPAWIAEGAAGLDDRIGIGGPVPRTTITAPLPGPSAVLRDTGSAVAGYAFSPSADPGAGAAADGTATAPAALSEAAEADALGRALGDPTVLAAVLQTASIDFRTLVHDAVTAVVGAVVDLAGDAVNVPGAVANNVLPLVAALINIPVAVAVQFMSSAGLVFEALATLDPVAVTDAFNQGAADVQKAALDAVDGVADAWDTMRGDVTTALRPPAPSVAASPSRASHSSVPSVVASDRAATDHSEAGLARAIADDVPSEAKADGRSSATPGVGRKTAKTAVSDAGPTAGTQRETREHADTTKSE